MKRTHLVLLGIGFAILVPAALTAELAYTTKRVNMRAGPSQDYELVMQLPAGSPVEVGGCVDDWTWCDVYVGNDRGWVYAGNLEYPYEGRRVSIMTYGPRIGLPIAPFIVGTYWDTYYRGRPWYGRRSYWIGHAGPSHVVVVHPGVRSGVVRHPVGVRPGRVVAVHPAHVAPVHPARIAPAHPARVAPRAHVERKH